MHIAKTFALLPLVLLMACARQAPPAAEAASSNAASSGGVALPPGAGWTGLTDPKGLILARYELMEHMEELMKPIDTLTVSDVRDPSIQLNAEVVGAMLGTVPYLFPPTTNLYDPQSLTPETLALPPIWENFDTFQALAVSAAKEAEAMAEAEGLQAQRAQSLKLRASCDACHEVFVRKYVPPSTQPSDAEFDFDSVLSK